MRKLWKYLGILLVLEMLVCLAAVVPAHAAVTASLSSYSGAPQTSVTVSGTTTAPGAVTVSFDSLQVWNATPSGSAAPYTWSVAITVPQVLGGSHYIKASQGTDAAPDIAFTVIPKVILSRLSGSPGNTVTVTGYGFAASDTVTINFNGSSAGTGYADATSGTWSSSISVPSLAAGSYNIDFVSSSGASIASQYFSLISIAAISPSLRSGQVGSSVSLSGTGFLANESVSATFDGTPVGNQATASSTGAWTISFTVPSSPGGSHTISAYGTTTSASSITGITFTINPPLHEQDQRTGRNTDNGQRQRICFRGTGNCRYRGWYSGR